MRGASSQGLHERPDGDSPPGIFYAITETAENSVTSIYTILLPHINEP